MLIFPNGCKESNCIKIPAEISSEADKVVKEKVFEEKQAREQPSQAWNDAGNWRVTSAKLSS